MSYKNVMIRMLYFNLLYMQSLYENSFGTVCIGRDYWGIRMRNINSYNENDSLLKDFVCSNCTIQFYINKLTTNNNTKDIIVLCDGKDIIKYDFELKRSEILNPGFYMFGNIETNENYEKLYSAMINMVENGCRKTQEMLKTEKYYTVNGKYFFPIYKTIIRKISTRMLFDEYIYFSISDNIRIKHKKSLILNMNKLSSTSELINNYL